MRACEVTGDPDIGGGEYYPSMGLDGHVVGATGSFNEWGDEHSDTELEYQHDGIYAGWIDAADNITAGATASIKPTKAVSYDVRIDAADASGAVDTKTFNIKAA